MRLFAKIIWCIYYCIFFINRSNANYVRNNRNANLSLATLSPQSIKQIFQVPYKNEIWTALQSKENITLFKFFEYKTDRWQAELLCQQFNGHLAEFNDLNELQMINELVQNEERLVWVRIPSEGYFPNRSIMESQSHCVVLNSNSSSIFLSKCTELNAFVCEYRRRPMVSQKSRKSRDTFSDVSSFRNFFDEKRNNLWNIDSFKESLFTTNNFGISTTTEIPTTTPIIKKIATELELKTTTTTIFEMQKMSPAVDYSVQALQSLNIKNTVNEAPNKSTSHKQYQSVLETEPMTSQEPITTTTVIPERTTIEILPVVDYETWKKNFAPKFQRGHFINANNTGHINNDNDNILLYSSYNNTKTDLVYEVENTNRNVRVVRKTIGITSNNKTNDNNNNNYNSSINDIKSTNNNTKVTETMFYTVDLPTDISPNTSTPRNTSLKVFNNEFDTTTIAPSAIKRIIIFRIYVENNPLLYILIAIFLFVLFMLCFMAANRQKYHATYAPIQLV